MKLHTDMSPILPPAGFENFFFGIPTVKWTCSNFGKVLFVCVEVLWPSQPNGVMSSVVS